MTEQWRELKETITEMRDNGGTGTQQDVCKFLANYMETLEKQMQQPMRDATEEERKSVKDYVESISKPTGFNFYEAQPCEDCISRAYIAPIIEELEYDQIDNDYVLSLLSDIKNAPSVNPQRPKGKWIKTEGSFKCSECLIFPEYIRTLNYCPNCGSYNGGEEDEI